MSNFRLLPLINLTGAIPPKRGSQPGGIVWIKPDELGVDTRYQRELGAAGLRRVEHIAMNFDWRKFTPIIVSRRAGATGYVIIDGQHRAAAILARGDISQIPSWVIEADLAGQAQTFLTINAESARVASGAMWYARAATGDGTAAALLQLCESVNIEVLKYPLAGPLRRFNQTNAPSQIDESRRLYGSAAIRWSLLVLRDAGEASSRCMLTSRSIRAIAALRKRNPQWSDARPAIAFALQDLRLEHLEARAAIKAKNGDGTRQDHFVTLVQEHIANRLERNS